MRKRSCGTEEVLTKYECQVTYGVKVRLPADADEETVEDAAEKLVRDGLATLIENDVVALSSKPG